VFIENLEINTRFPDGTPLDDGRPSNSLARAKSYRVLMPASDNSFSGSEGVPPKSRPRHCVDSGTKCNRFMRTGFARLCQAL
jgi:hypothetical protein